MKAHLSYLWERLSSSYWLVPTVVLGGVVGLSFVTLTIDYRNGAKYLTGVGWFRDMGVDGARALLSTIASSMITVAGVVFSITIVVLTLAASQYGPRILRNFLRDRGNQLVLGVFVATFAYCVLVLRVVGGSGFVPYLSTTVALLLAAVSLLVLIYFIHHVSTSIQASHIIDSAERELLAAIARMYPERREPPDESRPADTSPALPEDDEGASVSALHRGYVVRVDLSELVELAAREELLIRIDCHPGRFAVSGGHLARVWPRDRVSPELSREIADFFVMGSQRTPRQDVVFAMNQIVEIAVRALSPGVNDPFTAVNCLDVIGEALNQVARREIPSPHHRDETGRIRVILRPASFSDIADAGLNQIRQNARTNAAVSIRIIETLAAFAGQLIREEDRQSALRHAELVRRSAEEGLSDRHDYEVVEDRYQKFLDLMARPSMASVKTG